MTHDHMRLDTEHLAQALEDWAQNEEMIDGRYLPHGETCLEAASKLRDLDHALGVACAFVVEMRTNPCAPFRGAP